MLRSEEKAFYIDSLGRKKIVTISGHSGYSVTVRDEYGRILEFPAGKLQPLTEEGNTNEG